MKNSVIEKINSIIRNHSLTRNFNLTVTSPEPFTKTSKDGKFIEETFSAIDTDLYGEILSLDAVSSEIDDDLLHDIAEEVSTRIIYFKTPTDEYEGLCESDLPDHISKRSDYSVLMYMFLPGDITLLPYDMPSPAVLSKCDSHRRIKIGDASNTTINWNLN